MVEVTLSKDESGQRLFKLLLSIQYPELKQEIQLFQSLFEVFSTDCFIFIVTNQNIQFLKWCMQVFDIRIESEGLQHFTSNKGPLIR